MYCGKRSELEAQGANGDYYSIWFECETDYGEGLHPDTLDTDIEGDAYDNWDEAREAVEGVFRGTGLFEAFLDENPDIAWVAASIEKNEFEDGIDRGCETPIYAMMLSRDENGAFTWSFEDEFRNITFVEAGF